MSEQQSYECDRVEYITNDLLKHNGTNSNQITIFLHNFQRYVVYPLRNDGSVVDQVDIMGK